MLNRVILYGLCCFPVGAFAQAPWTFDDLMAALSEHPAFHTEFEEERSSFFLSRPIKIKGTLVFIADVKMEKNIQSPFVETIVIDNDAVVIKRTNKGGKEEITHTTRYALASHPVVAKAVRGVSNIFKGDSSILDEQYTWELSGTRDDWSLVLKPRGEKLAEYIEAIEVRGQ